MYHSITFIDENENEINTWDTLQLIPSSRPLVVPPSVEFNFVELPMAREPLDATLLKYGTREGDWQFVVSQDSEKFIWKDFEANQWIDLRQFTVKELANMKKTYGSDDWVTRYVDLLAQVPGHETLVVLEDDPDHFYEGRVMISAWQTGASFSSVTFHYILEPYKRSIDDPTIYSL